MTKPPSQPRPSREKPKQPDFSPFEDWLIDGPAGEWPEPWEADHDLSERQKQIVAANAALLLDREAWRARVAAFEAAIKKLPDEARRKEMRAKHRIRFDRHQFADGPKDFSGYSFPCSVWYLETIFGDGGVTFSSARFDDGDILFNRSKFGRGYIMFDGANFGSGDISFQQVAFNDGNVWSDRTIFGEGEVSFDGAIFGESLVSFFHANFGDGDFRFRKVSIGGRGLLFSGARFGDGNIWFEDIVLQSTIIPAADMTVAGNLYVSSHFPKAVDFSRLEVKGTASFSGSSFAKVPDFRDAKFDRPPEVAGMEVPRPKLGRGGGHSKLSPLSRALFSTALDAGDVAKYRKLKAMALAANDHEKDGEFFAGEMLAKRGVETTSFAGLLFNTFYWKFSDFGQSFTLPLKWMSRLILVFATINVAVLQIGAPSTLATIPSRFEAMVFSAVLSLKNAVPLLGSLFRFASAPDGHTGWFQSYYDTLKPHSATADWLIGLGATQSILGGVLLFLFLLALRNKFRLK